MITLLFSAALAAAPPSAGAGNTGPAVERASSTLSSVRATLVLQVGQRDAASSALVAEAERLGGYFTHQSSDSLVVRVPAGALGGLVDLAGTLGLVADRTWSSDDLTAEWVELRARLKAREEVLAKLFAMLPQATPKAVLTVEQEIASLVGEVEGLKGRIRVLESRADLAQLDVAFQFRDRSAPVRDGSSSFAWLNTVNLADLLDDFATGAVRRGRRPTGSPVPPEGMSAYRARRTRPEFRATSPDRVLYRVRAARHEPRAELAFWREALSVRMADAGYLPLRSSDMNAHDREGFLLEVIAPVGSEDYVYALAIFPGNREITIVEAAGVAAAYEARRERVLDAIRDL